MELSADATIPFDVEQVFAAYRDRMAELSDYLPNIQRIEVRERTERDGGVVELVNEWIGGGDIPKVVRGVLDESMLRWTDYASWDPDGHRVAWRTQVHAFSGAVSSSGENRFVACDAGTRLEIRGDLVCHPDKMPVPGMLKKKVAATLEKVLVGKVGENLIQVAEGFGAMLARDRR
jgi:hypothetical protein